MKCMKCKFKLKRNRLEKIYNAGLKNEKKIVNIPSLYCQNCNEYYIDQLVDKNIERYIRDSECYLIDYQEKQNEEGTSTMINLF